MAGEEQVPHRAFSPVRNDKMTMNISWTDLLSLGC